MKYVFDIDGTICTLTDGQYENATPLVGRIGIVNKLYEEGNYITFYTARGMGRFDDDSRLAHDEFYDLTYEQLSNWGVKFNKLLLGKPSGDIYVDDKGIKDIEFFEG